MSSQKSWIDFEKGSDMIGIMFQKMILAGVCKRYWRERSKAEKQREGEKGVRKRGRDGDRERK